MGLKPLRLHFYYCELPGGSKNNNPKFKSFDRSDHNISKDNDVMDQ